MRHAPVYKVNCRQKYEFMQALMNITTDNKFIGYKQKLNSSMTDDVGLPKTDFSFCPCTYV